MKIWIILVSFSILLSCPTLSGAGDDISDPGKSTLFNYPLVKIPIGSKSDSNTSKEKMGDEEANYDETKEKEKHDKKVDDAIKKAWDEK
jgi:predicted small secreted protein